MSFWGDDPVEGTYGIIDDDGTEKLFSYFHENKWIKYDSFHNGYVMETPNGWDTGVIVPRGTIQTLIKKSNIEKK